MASNATDSLESLLTEKRSISNCDLEVPAICFGTSGLGSMPDTYGYEVDEARALKTINAIFESEFSFVDTSRNYGAGRSEQRIGQVVKQQGGLPQNVVVSTKLDRNMESGVFDAARARQSIEESLEAMNIERVHILHLHDPEYALSLDDITAADGALSELFKMKEEGLADAVGLAAGKVDVMTPLIHNWDFDCLITHNRFTLLNRNAEAMIDLACSRNISVLNAAPFASGALARGAAASPRYVYEPASAEIVASIQQIEAICAPDGIPIGAAALQFSLRDKRITSTICGITQPDRVEQTRQWAKWPISDEIWSALDALPHRTDDPEASRDYKPG